MYLAVIALTAILILLFVPIRLKVSAKFDILANSGNLDIESATFKIINNASFFLGFNKLTLVGKNGKTYETEIWGIGQNSKFADNFILFLLRGLKLKKLKLYALAGVQNNAHLTAMLCSALLIPSQMILSLAANKKKLTTCFSSVLPSFCANELKIANVSVVSINVFLILKCLAFAIYKVLKGVLNGCKSAH